MAVDKAIINSVNIADVIAKETGQKMIRKGNNTVQTKCPFHGGSDSFKITYKYSEGGHYKCFNGSCGKKGDIITFIQDYKRMTFSEAILYLRKEYGMKFDISPEEIKKSIRKEKEKKIFKLVKLYYHWNLFNHDKKYKAINYLKKRKISLEMIKKHKIGFAPFNDPKFIPFMNSKGVNEQTLLKLELIKKNNNGKLVPYFRNRIMFGLYGRSLGNDKNYAHLYSPHMHTELYNFENAKKAELVVVSESHFDGISLEQVLREDYPEEALGFATAYGANGFKEEYLKDIKKTNIKNFILAYDGDKAGIEGMIKDGYMLENAGYRVGLMKIPFGTDQNRLLKLGQKNLIKKAFRNANRTPLEIDIELMFKNYVTTHHNGKKIITLNRLNDLIEDLVMKIDKQLFQKEIKGYLLKRPLVAKIIVDNIFGEIDIDKKLKNNLNKYYNQVITQILQTKIK